jgi:hypothetical protein
LIKSLKDLADPTSKVMWSEGKTNMCAARAESVRFVSGVF